MRLAFLVNLPEPKMPDEEQEASRQVTKMGRRWRIVINNMLVIIFPERQFL
jgi:hypothetical protein